jgi:hypothetical protein
MTGFLQAVFRSAASNSAPEVSGAAKKQGKKCRNKEEQRCLADIASCRAQVVAGCQGSPQCVANSAPCCDTCSADGLLNCLLVASSSRTAIINPGR